MNILDKLVKAGTQALADGVRSLGREFDTMAKDFAKDIEEQQEKPKPQKVQIKIEKEEREQSHGNGR